jgi:hypothetical protein
MKSVLQQMSSGVVPGAHRSNDAGLPASTEVCKSVNLIGA